MAIGLYFITALLAFFIFNIVCNIVKRMHICYTLTKVPGLPIAPVIGNAYHLSRSRDPTVFFRRMIRCCDLYPGGIFRMFMGPMGIMPLVCIYNAEGAEAMLNSKTNITKGYGYEYLMPWLGTGLLTSTGSKWFHRRKMLTPTFHFRILDDFVSIFNEQSAILVDKLDRFANGTVFDVFPHVTLCLLDIICETAMGKKINAQCNGNSEYVNAITRMSHLSIMRMWNIWYWNDTAYSMFFAKEYDRCLNTIHGLTKSVIHQRDAERKARTNNNNEKSSAYHDSSSANHEASSADSKGKKLAFLELLLQMKDEHNNISFSDIQEEVDTFMFEGHDTTAAAANWALYLLGSHPDIQQRVVDELDHVFADRDEPCTLAKLEKLQYLGCVLKETLRLYPSVPTISRQIVEDCTIHGYKIPKGTDVMLIIYQLHRDPEYFPDPEKFDPNRFLPGNKNNMKRHAFSYVPFSAGLRNYIGQRFATLELKVVLSSILRRFRVESVDPIEDINLHAEMVLRPENGIHVKLAHR